MIDCKKYFSYKSDKREVIPEFAILALKWFEITPLNFYKFLVSYAAEEELAGGGSVAVDAVVTDM